MSPPSKASSSSSKKDDIDKSYFIVAWTNIHNLTAIVIWLDKNVPSVHTLYIIGTGSEGHKLVNSPIKKLIVVMDAKELIHHLGDRYNSWNADASKFVSNWTATQQGCDKNLFLCKSADMLLMLTDAASEQSSKSKSRSGRK